MYMFRIVISDKFTNEVKNEYVESGTRTDNYEKAQQLLQKKTEDMVKFYKSSFEEDVKVENGWSWRDIISKTSKFTITIIEVPDFKIEKISNGFYNFLEGKYALNKEYSGCYSILICTSDYIPITYHRWGGQYVYFENFWEARRFIKDNWGSLWYFFKTYRKEKLKELEAKSSK